MHTYSNALSITTATNQPIKTGGIIFFAIHTFISFIMTKFFFGKSSSKPTKKSFLWVKKRLSHIFVGYRVHVYIFFIVVYVPSAKR